MKIKRIAITGDDGYNSLGTRLLILALRDKYDLTVFATKTQHSGTGGLMNLKTGFDWGKTVVEEVPAYWVKGSPVDAVEFAANYINPFDLVVSGVNWGANLGSGIFSSGTVNAAIRALSAQVSPQAIAISWDLPPEFFLMNHNLDHTIEEYLAYPGDSIDKLLDVVIKNNFWKADFLNINLPFKKSNKVKITKSIPYINEVYKYRRELLDPQSKSGHYNYDGNRVESFKGLVNFRALHVLK